MRKPYLKGIRRIVVKLGTSVLTSKGRFDDAAIRSLSVEMSAFMKRGVQFCVVSSGAIGAGMSILNLKSRPGSMEGLQGAAAVGQRHLMERWEKGFAKRGHTTAQVLLTWDDLADSKRRMNAKRTLEQIQRWGAVPVVNENDTVATDEIRFGDNDRLSSLLAILVEADLLVILSDTDGLYEDGQRHDASKRLKVVEAVGDRVFEHVKDEKTQFTTGGMASKLRSIRTATSSGIPAILADGGAKNVLTRLLKGEDLGTFFLPSARRAHGDWAEQFAAQLKASR